MTNLQWLNEMLARLTRGATPVDGITVPTGHEAHEGQAATREKSPPESRNAETEFDTAMIPRWGNFR